MSYILDALRKADAQRARDPVRGIHAQPMRTVVRADARSGLRPGVLGACAAGVVALALAGWYLYPARGAAPVAPPPAVVVQAPVVHPAPPMPVAARVPSAPTPVVGNAIQPPPPAPVIVAQVVPALVPRPAASVAPTAQSPVIAPPMPVPSVGTPPPMPGTSPNFVPAPAAVPPHPSTATAPPVTGLPPDAPKLAISGGVYSANRAQRLLIVNGQVFNEGSEIGPGVVLEEIKAKTAVLRFHGARYTVTY